MQRPFISLLCVLGLLSWGCAQPTANAAYEPPTVHLPQRDPCDAPPLLRPRREGTALADTAALRATGSNARLAPQRGAYFGVNLDWTSDTPAAYSGRVGYHPAVYVQFLHFPLDAGGRRILAESARLVAPHQGSLLVTLEPWGGLEAIDQAAVDAVTHELRAVNDMSVPVFVRFAHEMNGSWYPWSQQPATYVRVFRALAEALHAEARQTAMVWAPNYGGGYPFSGGRFEARPGTPHFAPLDTNGDGRLDMQDDPYAPYYPGDDAVDWAGMSLYHWGTKHPWGENVPPEPGKFLRQLTGSYRGAKNDCGIPDFYRQYGVLRGKPIAIAETAALFNTENGDAEPDELAIKRLWWEQVYTVEMLETYPALRMLNWFEWRKAEPEVRGAIVDWGVTRSQAVREAFTEHLATLPLQFAPEP